MDRLYLVLDSPHLGYDPLNLGLLFIGPLLQAAARGLKYSVLASSSLVLDLYGVHLNVGL